MNDQPEIDLYQAIHQMRVLSARGTPFSFIHATYNRDTGLTEGLRHVKSAHLRPAAKGDDLSHAGEKIFYFDLEIQKPRVCWQCLLMYFEDKKVLLS